MGAQITINLPKIKKIPKPDIRSNIERTVNDTADTTNTTTGRTDVNGSTDWWIDYQIDAITKYKQLLGRWNPANEVFPKPSTGDELISLALSKKERASWLQDFRAANIL